MMTLFFTKLKEIKNYNDAQKCQTEKYSEFFKIMLDKGIYLPPSQFEAMFISTALNKNDINKLIDACNFAFKKIK